MAVFDFLDPSDQSILLGLDLKNGTLDLSGLILPESEAESARSLMCLLMEQESSLRCRKSIRLVSIGSVTFL